MMRIPVDAPSLLIVSTGETPVGAAKANGWSIRLMPAAKAVSVATDDVVPVHAMLLHDPAFADPVLCRKLAEARPGIPLIVATGGFASAEHRAACLRSGAVAILPADFGPEELEAHLARIGPLGRSSLNNASGSTPESSLPAQDTPETRRAEAELRASEARYRQLFELSPQPMWIIDTETLHFLDVNAAALQHYGYSAEEFRRMTLADIRSAGDLARLKTVLASRQLDRPTSDGIWRHIKKDGSEIEVEIFSHRMDYKGRNARWVMITDVTERARAERKLMESEERFAAALRAGRLGVFDFNVLTKELAWSERSREIWGLTGDDELNMAVFEQGINPEDRELVRAAVAKAFRNDGDHFYTADYRVKNRKDGSERWVHAEGDVEFTNGRPVRFVGTVQDITARKRIEWELHEQQRLYKTVTDNASLALFIMDDRQQCIFMNPAAERLTGFTLEELKGRPLHDCIHHTHPDGTPYPLGECPIDQAFPKNDRESGEEVFVHRDGRFYDVRFTASPIRARDGNPTGTVIEVEDITERKRTERRIQLLMREVNHRSKNMLSVVQAIVTQTAAAKSPEDFATSFRERLQGLAASHDLLVSNEWRGVGLADLISSQLRHFAGPRQSRIVFGGQHVHLTPGAAQALGMALHELATNAGKYGALSGEGRIDITWEVDHPKKRFGMRWAESGGPEVTPPQHKGFGSRLIAEMTRMSLEGDVTLDYAPTGLVWNLVAPLERIIGSGDCPDRQGRNE